VVGIVLFIAFFRTTFVLDAVEYPSDVGLVMQSGAEALIRGEHLYGVSRPEAMRVIANDGGFTPTLTMSGHLVSDYGYPPLGAVITAALVPLTPGLPTAAIVSALAMIITAVLLFKLLPTALRPAAALVCFVVGPAVGYSANGYPAIMALPFPVFAVANWPLTGAAGTLGRRGVAQAVCFGLAMATHQLVWYVAPFILVGLWLIRRGHLGGRVALRLTGSYLGIMAATWGAVNLPFVVQDPGAWWRGMLEPLTQHAVPFGQGLVGFASFYSGGAGRPGHLGDGGRADQAADPAGDHRGAHDDHQRRHPRRPPSPRRGAAGRRPTGSAAARPERHLHRPAEGLSGARPVARRRHGDPAGPLDHRRDAGGRRRARQR
jgi:hypothetical protein